MRWSPRGTAQRDPNPAASMALLDEVLDPPLGPGYYSAAEARRAAGLPASSGFRTILVGLSAVFLGFLITVAATTLRTPDPVVSQTRLDLITRVEAAQAAGDAEAVRVEALRAEVAELEKTVVVPADAGATGTATSPGSPTADVSSAGAAAGAQALIGPGVVITMNDAPRDPTTIETPEKAPERVNARDLVLVVNGLWTAGAEAISVNGHRLTASSAIRYAGQAIIVDFRGLTPPYEIRAIGDPARLKDELSAGVTGAYLGELRKQLSLQAEVSHQDQIEIGAASRLTTRVGHVLDDVPTEESP